MALPLWSCLSIAALGVSLIWVLALSRTRLTSLVALSALDLLGLLLALTLGG